MARLHILLTDDFIEMEKEEQYEVYSEFYRLVYGMVFSMVREHAETEDVLQEVFIRLVSKTPMDKDTLHIKGWIFKVTRNVALNYLRKLKKSRDPLRGSFFEVTGEIVSSSSVEQQVEESFLEQMVSDCIDQLKPEYQQIVELRIVHEFSYKEIAAIMDISEGAVRQRLARGKKAIRNLLVKDWMLTDDPQK